MHMYTPNRGLTFWYNELGLLNHKCLDFDRIVQSSPSIGFAANKNG